MVAGSHLNEPIVCLGMNERELVPVRNNPRITKVEHFANFAGGYLVGVSVASHPIGEECGRHNHRGAHELFVVMSGRGIIEVGEDSHEVHAGDSVLVPVGFDHNLIGRSLAPFKVLCGFIVAPGHENDKTPWKAVS